MRGHEVTLYEKESKLGGLLPLAALLKDIEVSDFMALVNYFAIQLKKLGVKVVLGQEANDTVITDLKPDVIIVAGGGVHAIPDVPGIKGKNVVTSEMLHKQLKSFLKMFGPQTLEGLTKIWMPLGKRVVVIGGRIQGCEVSEFLVKRGRKVTIVDEADALGEGMTGDDKFQLFPWFDKKGVKRYLGVTYKEITTKGISFKTKEGTDVTLEADTIITALPVKTNTVLMKKMEGKAAEVIYIGDCQAPQLIPEATATGATAGNSI
jgi:2,4-dienoyl-CoA reductase (NADPH2)